MTAPLGSAPRPRHDFSPSEIDGLEDRLYDFNRAVTGRDDGLGLGFEILGRAGELIGAIAGYSWADVAEIRQLWVEQGHRGSGLGRALVEAFVAEAGARGCALVFVTSYDFQAPGLYERCGFARAAELADFPPGHVNVILRLALPRPGETGP